MAITNPDNIITVGGDILPIFTVRQLDEQNEEVLTFEGTGFLIGPQVIVTCWHCVRRLLPNDQRYAVILPRGTECYGLSDIEQHPNGLDLASARIQALAPLLKWSFASDDDVLVGHDVWSYGYPLGMVTPGRDGMKEINVAGRYLRGYVTRTFAPHLLEYGRTRTIEVDMPAPAGLSGAPLVLAGRRMIVGVVYGSQAVSQIEELEHVDAETGARFPEIHRIVNFAVAHAPSSLGTLTGAALSGRPLAEWVENTNAGHR